MVVENDRTMKLVMQFLSERGFRAALAALEEETEITYDSDAVALASELPIIVEQYDALARMTEDTGSGELSVEETQELLVLGDDVYCKAESKSIAGLHTSNIICVAAGADPECPWVATGAVDRTITVTDLPSGKAVWKSAPRGGSVLSVALHPADPLLLLSGDMNGEVVVSRAAVAPPAVGGGADEPEPEPEPEPEAPLAKFQEHTKYVVRVLWSPDGTRFASASYDKSVCLYAEEEPGSGTWKLEHKWLFAGTVECILFVTEQSMLVSVRDSHLLFVLDLTNYERTDINLNPNLDDWVSFTAMDLSLSPNKKWLLVATDKSKLLVYKLGGSDQVRQFYGADNDGFSNPRCLWHPSGLYVYCTAQDNAVHVVSRLVYSSHPLFLSLSAALYRTDAVCHCACISCSGKYPPRSKSGVSVATASACEAWSLLQQGTVS
jgi:COMPASS component SWD3